MADFPVLAQESNQVIIPSDSIQSVGQRIRPFGPAQPVSTVWPTANKAMYIPFVVASLFIATQILVLNGSAVSGNCDVGIYDDQGNRLVSQGSTAQSGTSAIQAYDITDTTLQPGVYYMAVAFDNTTATTFAYALNSVIAQRATGCLMQTSAFVLPATATFAACVDAYIPMMAVTSRTFA